jgi:hypothetical protein
MHWQQVGVMMFGVVVALNVLGLTIDGLLVANDLPTLTEFCRRNPWGAGFVLLVNLVGLVGLAMHFSNGFDGPRHR